MLESIQTFAEALKPYQSLISTFGAVVGVVALAVSYFIKAKLNRQTEKLERQRQEHAQKIQDLSHANQVSLEHMRTAIERKATLDSQLRTTLEELWACVSSACRHKFALMGRNDHDKGVVAGELSAARVAVKNRMYDTIYVTDAVIQALRAFDQLLGNPQTGYGTIVAENTKLRKLFRFLAGLEPEGEVLMLSVAPSVEVTSAGRVASETDMSAAVAGIFRTLG